MKKILSLTFMILSFSCAKKGAEKKSISHNSPKVGEVDNSTIVFRRGDSIYSKIDNGNENLIGVGSFPCVSPDGEKLTYTKYGTEFRRVYLLDLKTKNEVKLNVPSDNFYNAIWSPDGEFIAFSIMGTDDWEIGLIKSDNTGFKTIKGKPEYGLESPTWTADSKSIVANNLVDLIEFDIDGNIIRQFNIRETIADSCYVSGGDRLWLTSDRNRVFINSGVNEGMEGVEGPVEAISFYDIEKKIWRRISPTGLYCSDLFMLSDSKVVFSGSKEGQLHSDLYIYDFSRDKIDLFIENGREPSGTRLN